VNEFEEGVKEVKEAILILCRGKELLFHFSFVLS
jgi:hypothetical protein